MNEKSEPSGGVKKILVVGVGNVLLKDEGVGVHVVGELAKMDLPDNVELIDGATSGFDLIALTEGADKLIIVDVVDADSEPGDIFRFTPEDVEESAQRDKPAMSLHDIGLIESLMMAKHLGQNPETIIIAVQPKDLSWGMEPTPEIQARIPRLIELVLEEIEKS